MALGIVAILLIVVTGLAAMYMRELKLSRFSYDEILANASAQWAFEYAMLKIKNHEDGFQDAFSSEKNNNENFFGLSTPRSKNLEVEYRIESQSKDEIFSISKNSSIVIPLFVGDDDILFGESKKPLLNEKIEITKWLKISVKTGNPQDLQWNIVARNALDTDVLNTNYILYGNGDISPTLQGEIQLKTIRCSYVNSWWNVVSEEWSQCDELSFKNEFDRATTKEQLVYDYTQKMKISNFIEKEYIGDSRKKSQQSYIILKNTSNNVMEVHLEADSPFALPKKKITAIARKNDALQKFEFTQDKTDFYQILLNAY